MWLVYMTYPVVNTSDTQKKGATLLAQGLVRIDEMQIGRARTEKEAKQMCLKLAVQTIKDRKLDSTVVGFGIRNYYAGKNAKLKWKLTVQQVMRLMAAQRKADAA